MTTRKGKSISRLGVLPEQGQGIWVTDAPGKVRCDGPSQILCYIMSRSRNNLKKHKDKVEKVLAEINAIKE